MGVGVQPSEVEVVTTDQHFVMTNPLWRALHRCFQVRLRLRIVALPQETTVRFSKPCSGESARVRLGGIYPLTPGMGAVSSAAFDAGQPDQRWAEGGLQRFFDYWPALLSSRLKPRLKRDVLAFFLLQYVQPLVMTGDVVGAVVGRSAPLAWPLTTMTLLFTVTAMLRCPTDNSGPPVPAIRGFTILMTLAYVLHWSLVIPFVAVGMALKPKHRAWDKTCTGA